ncbi:hypothetical protein [Anaerotignum sp.]|uniref:hypothetical protein n=1 Tax=Anaerotignum sp. TaxID=2039241 RepID=UPI00289BF400|nr:hypothetical protein [Anaerotignum sp.]
MTNKEKYKQAFSTMHIPDEFSLEVKKMTTTSNNKPKLNRLVASIAACVLIVGCATVAYATDFCGIQRTLQLWINGDQTDVTIQFDGNGNYNMNYIDAEGDSKNRGGGGVFIEDDGTERPLTDDELIEEITAPDVQYEDNGSVWVYWFDQKIDITDKFENNVCYIKLVKGEETLYMTVKYQNGYATAPDRYQSPSSFN